MGVWIETLMGRINPSAYSSHPTWVCGLKRSVRYASCPGFVTPYVGVWIETIAQAKKSISESVTPYVGVWIET